MSCQCTYRHGLAVGSCYRWRIRKKDLSLLFFPFAKRQILTEILTKNKKAFEDIIIFLKDKNCFGEANNNHVNETESNKVKQNDMPKLHSLIIYVSLLVKMNGR